MGSLTSKIQGKPPPLAAISLYPKIRGDLNSGNYMQMRQRSDLLRRLEGQPSKLYTGEDTEYVGYEKEGDPNISSTPSLPSTPAPTSTLSTSSTGNKTKKPAPRASTFFTDTSDTLG